MCAKYVINGPCKLRGEIRVGGSKNSVLKIMAACLLATRPVTLRNVPDILDVAYMVEILEAFGMRITRTPGGMRLDPIGVRYAAVPDDLARKLRSSIMAIGPSLARFGKAETAHPGGDVIGKRHVDTHFEGLTALGGRLRRAGQRYRISGQLRGAEIFLSEASVTATQNVMLGAVLAPGRTVIHNAASELHVVDLAIFLGKLGARIAGAGTNRLIIDGVRQLGGASHSVRSDEIEAATWIIAAAVTGGEVTVSNIDPEHFGLILLKLQEAGVRMTVGKRSVKVKGPHRLRSIDVHTNVWPGFPTDLTSPFTVLMTQARGVSLIHDWMYEGRFFYTDKLNAMGAKITLADPHRILVYGPTRLTGSDLESPDIRAGVTLVVAALLAKGQTTIDHAEQVDKGYERVDERLRALGADVRRVE